MNPEVLEKKSYDVMSLDKELHRSANNVGMLLRVKQHDGNMYIRWTFLCCISFFFPSTPLALLILHVFEHSLPLADLIDENHPLSALVQCQLGSWCLATQGRQLPRHNAGAMCPCHGNGLPHPGLTRYRALRIIPMLRSSKNGKRTGRERKRSGLTIRG